MPIEVMRGKVSLMFFCLQNSLCIYGGIDEEREREREREKREREKQANNEKFNAK